MKLSDETLRQEYFSRFNSIYMNQTYSTQDILNLICIEGELRSRGYIIHISQNPSIFKPEKPREDKSPPPGVSLPIHGSLTLQPGEGLFIFGVMYEKENSKQDVVSVLG